MQRRTFVNMATSATMAFVLKPSACAGEQEAKHPIPYPDPAVEVLDPRFAKYQIISAAVERFYTGARWAEGPVWIGDGRYLLFSDIPNNRMLRWLEETGEVSVFRSPSNYSNGNTRDRQGQAAHLRTRHSPRHSNRTRRHHHGAHRWLSGQEAQRSERSWSSTPTAPSGSPIPATESCRITKGTKLLSNFRPTFIGLTRRRASQRSLSAIWQSPMACASPLTRNCFTSSIARFPSTPAIRCPIRGL